VGTNRPGLHQNNVEPLPCNRGGNTTVASTNIKYYAVTSGRIFLNQRDDAFISMTKPKRLILEFETLVVTALRIGYGFLPGIPYSVIPPMEPCAD